MHPTATIMSVPRSQDRRGPSRRQQRRSSPWWRRWRRCAPCPAAPARPGSFRRRPPRCPQPPACGGSCGGGRARVHAWPLLRVVLLAGAALIGALSLQVVPVGVAGCEHAYSRSRPEAETSRPAASLPPPGKCPCTCPINLHALAAATCTHRSALCLSRRCKQVPKLLSLSHQR